MIESSLKKVVVADVVASRLEELTAKEPRVFGLLGHGPSVLEEKGISEKKGYQVVTKHINPIHVNSPSEEAERLYELLTDMDPDVLVVNPWHVGQGYPPYGDFAKLLKKPQRNTGFKVIIYTDAKDDDFNSIMNEFGKYGVLTIAHGEIDNLAKTIKSY